MHQSTDDADRPYYLRSCKHIHEISHWMLGMLNHPSTLPAVKIMAVVGFQVSGNHRLDDCKAEQQRIKAQGFEISSSNVEGRPCGPLRVWPGGLAMGRSLGDFDVCHSPVTDSCTLL